MRPVDGGSSSNAVDLAQQRAEAERRAEEARERAERIKEQTEQHKVSAESNKFRGRQSQSTFDHGEGKTRTQRTSVNANRHGTTESTRRSQRFATGATASLDETKTTDRSGNTRTRSTTTATTARGRSSTRTRNETGTVDPGESRFENNSQAVLASKTLGQAEIGNQQLVGGKTTLPGGIQADGGVNGPGAAASATASAGFSGGDLKVGVDVKLDAHALAAHGGLEKDVDVKVGGQDFKVKLKLGANAEIGANGELHLDLDIGAHGAKVDASASGFAGAAGSLTAGVELDEVKGGQDTELAQGSITGTAVAGVAGKAEFNAGFHNGTFGFHAAVQGAVGVGAGLEFNGDVNVGNTLGALKDVAVGLGKQAVDALGHSVVSAAKDLGNEVKDLNGYVNGLVDNGFNAAKNVISDGLHTAENVVKSGVNDVENVGAHVISGAKSLISSIPHPHISWPW